MRYLGISVLALFLGGCAGLLPGISSLMPGAIFNEADNPAATVLTNVNQSRNNFRVIATDIMGESEGFTLLMFLELSSPSRIEAMSDLCKKHPFPPKGSFALANFMDEKSSRDFILFGFPRYKVRADLIEFVEVKPAFQKDISAGTLKHPPPGVPRPGKDGKHPGKPVKPGEQKPEEKTPGDIPVVPPPPPPPQGNEKEAAPT